MPYPKNTVEASFTKGRVFHAFDSHQWAKRAPHQAICGRTGTIRTYSSRPRKVRRVACMDCVRIKELHDLLVTTGPEAIRWSRVHVGRLSHAFTETVPEGSAKYLRAACGQAGFMKTGSRLGPERRCKRCERIVAAALPMLKQEE